MLLRSFDISSKPVDFELADGPIEIDKKLVALSRNDFSPLIQIRLIVRGDKSTGVHEGDVITENGTPIGLVIYSAGFKMLEKSSRLLKEIPKGEHIQVNKGTADSVSQIVNSEYRTPITFAYGRLIIKGFKTILCVKDGMVVLNGKNFKYKYINAEEIKFYTGVQEYYFGDFIDGGYVVLHDGYPAIKRGEEYSKLESYQEEI